MAVIRWQTVPLVQYKTANWNPGAGPTEQSNLISVCFLSDPAPGTPGLRFHEPFGRAATHELVEGPVRTSGLSPSVWQDKDWDGWRSLKPAWPDGAEKPADLDVKQLFDGRYHDHLPQLVWYSENPAHSVLFLQRNSFTPRQAHCIQGGQDEQRPTVLGLRCRQTSNMM